MGEAAKILEQERNSGSIIFLPSALSGAQNGYYKPIIEKVQLSVNPEDRDVYPANKKLRITHQGLGKLERCAGVEWDPINTCRTDDRRDKLYVSFRAVGGVRKADGKLYYLKSEYDLDLEIIEEEIREGHLRKRKDKYNKNKSDAEFQEYVDFCTRRDFMQKRKHKLKLAESGAKDRIVRSLLGLKSEYTAQELNHPFIMVRFVLDHHQPEVKKVFLQAATNAINGIYGGELPPMIPAPQEPIDVTPAEVPEETPEPEEPNGQELDFMAQDTEAQVKTLETLAEQKGYDLEGFLKKLNGSLSGMSEEKRVEFFKYLLGMPNPTQA